LEITIKFLISQKNVTVYSGRTLLSIAREHRIPIMSPCGGNALCGGCKVKIVEGNDIMDVSAEEYNRLSDEQIEEGYRLACSYIVMNNITVEA
jgi:Na+-transporting NADH:ubiquinone oxidoreductase subunit NqrF